MKKFCSFCFISFLFFFQASIAQKSNNNSDKKKLIGFHFNTNDVVTPKNWKVNNSIQFPAGLQNSDLGFSISYYQTVASHVDFSTKATVFFHDYTLVDRLSNSSTSQKFGIEINPSFNVNVFRPTHPFNAFISAGITSGVYSNKWGFTVPACLGLSLYLNNKIFLIIESQYRFTLSKEVLSDNLFHSFGIAFNINKHIKTEKSEKKDVVILTSNTTDSDNDGIIDNEDKCPLIAGFAKYQGCPVPDTDKDGINDEEDGCPSVVGFAKYKGCPVPDTDGDGINDEEDKCIDLKGDRKSVV
jgi:hypothetical protein